MAVPCPPLLWPEMLVERGPPEDPSILLTGTAHIGGTTAQIVAIRINPGLGWGPDFRRGVATGSYEANELNVVLEMTLDELQAAASALGEVVGNSDASVVQLATGHYKIWVMLASAGS